MSNSLSYRDAGVDIDAGDQLVENIKPFAKRTMRPEVLGDLGGFGALAVNAAINTLLAFLVGWLVFAFGARVFARDAARLTVGWALLAVAIVMLPALFSFAFNGPLIGWTLPHFPTFFLGFLATLQALFIAAFGLLFAGIAAIIALARRSRARRPLPRTA